MPTYRYACKHCHGGFEQWQSIHDDALLTHPDCGGDVVRVITQVNTYGIGSRGAKTVEVDARERVWDTERPAYKRLRMDGLQPPAVIGSSNLEKRANDPMYVKSGGKVSVPDDRREEVNEMLAEGMTSSWNPIDTVHEKRGI